MDRIDERIARVSEIQKTLAASQVKQLWRQSLLQPGGPSAGQLADGGGGGAAAAQGGIQRSTTKGPGQQQQVGGRMAVRCGEAGRVVVLKTQGQMCIFARGCK